jgi:3-oxoadipate enol-lactonase
MPKSGLSSDPHLIRSFDETFIATRKLGEGPGVPLLIANAVAANLAPWRLTLRPLAADGPIVTWDHRGTFESGEPVSERLDPEAHARDAIAAMDHFDCQKFVLASWSSGARIALEIAHLFPERVLGVALVSAGYGYSMTRFFRHLELASLLPAVAGIAKRFATPLQGALKTLVGRPELAGIVRQAGMTSASADIGSLVELVQGVADSDLKILLETYEAVAGDPARSILPGIEAPALVVVGEHDQFVPRRVVEEMVGTLPHAELLIYEGATHYLPMEYPALLAEDLRTFFDRVV